MTRTEAREVIVKRLIASNLIPFERIDLPNKKFTIPAVGTGVWCRIRFSEGASSQRSLGGQETIARFERTARFKIQIFGDQGDGTSMLSTLAEDAANVYEKQFDRPLYYMSPDVDDGNVDPSGWYMYTVSVQYQFSVCK